MAQPAFEAAAPGHVSLADYLRLDQETQPKREYFRGEVREVPPISPAHDRIRANLAAAIGRRLPGSSRVIMGSDQRLFIEASATFCYPDLAVVCGPPAFSADQPVDTLLNPALLVQIVPAAPDGTWGGRFALYRLLPSLRQYLLVHSLMPYAEWHWRDELGRWLLTDTNAQPGMLDLSSVACQVPLAEVYAGVNIYEPSTT